MKKLKISSSITDRKDASLGIYFKDVSKLSLLTPEEEINLAKRIQQGDKQAENKLITSNLRFVISVAKQYQNKGLDLVDLIQEGNLGLIEGAKRYNPDKGFRFISYAVWWIRQSIIKAISDQCRTVRVPMNQIVCIGKVVKATEEIEQRTGREPALNELEELTQLSSEKINLSIAAVTKAISLETPVTGEDDAGCLLDIIPSNVSSTDSGTEKDDISLVLNNILDELSYRDRDIIRMYFGINMSSVPIDDIANMFGISGERVRQLIKEILEYIRRNYKKELKELQ